MMENRLGIKAKDKVRHKYHPEWGTGVVTHASHSLVVAEWEHHVQSIALPLACVEKASNHAASLTR